jgi:hypothetical protein
MAIIAVVAILGIAYLVFNQSADAQTNDTGVVMSKSDGSLTGATITADPSTWPGSDRIWEICCAIALAEGYNKGTGVVPYDLNNPGDISDGGGTYGSQPHSGSNVTTFPTAEIGWQWLYNKISNMVNGKSATFPASLTWTQVAQKYAGNWQNWLSNVTNYLGVDPNSTPKDYVNG